MALNFPTFPDPRGLATPVEDASGWASDAGRIAITINPDEVAWRARPIVVPSRGLEQGGAPKLAPKLDDLMADAEFAAASNTIGTEPSTLAVVHIPELAGVTPA